jgi:hypothetical protein
MKTIIIGCGATMEKGFGGTAKFSGDNWYPHALHTHTHCTTVDINPTCSPSIVLNFTTPNRAELVRKIGNEKFDLIVLENLPLFLLYKNTLNTIVTNSNYILSEIGHIFIPMVLDTDIERLEKAFSIYGFRLIRKSNDLSLIYPIITAFTGRYADEYMMMNNLKLMMLLKPNSANKKYLLFKR